MSIRIRLQKGQIKVELEIDSNADPDSVNTMVSLILQKLVNESNDIDKKPTGKQDNDRNAQLRGIMPKYQRIKQLILSYFPGTWFTSTDIKDLYESIFKEPIRHSTVTTYLRRMEEEGFLLSRRLGRYIEFKIADSIVPMVSIPSQPQIHNRDEI